MKHIEFTLHFYNILRIEMFFVDITGLEVKGQMVFGSQTLRYQDACDDVCRDLPIDDTEPVCMMISRYKRGYQFFVNQCHARRTICKENLVLHMVHPSRCVKSNQYFMPVN
ncbi:uncharacterized protein LOC116413674 [Galleria mellonella]|uniref:Uncharacterized protein LOC116413674 n=1 Tax=Galleria mellonella TaxID=7137 RepID=A0ABM3MQZ8_GALME|nr:uncharacterized protein LOC116413674 [Galleria mellonella]